MTRAWLTEATPTRTAVVNLQLLVKRHLTLGTVLTKAHMHSDDTVLAEINSQTAEEKFVTGQ